MARCKEGTVAVDLAEVLKLMELEQLDLNLYRGLSPVGRTMMVFGGQVIAQSIFAASKTVNEDRIPHSLHANFLRPGDPRIPIIFYVDRIRDGGSFNTRCVVARQNGEAIFNTSISFKVQEVGFSHQAQMPQGLPDPESLETDETYWDKMALKYPDQVPGRENMYFAIDTRPISRSDFMEPGAQEPSRCCWMRTNGRLPDDPNLHRCMLAYMSDLYLMGVALMPHGATFWSGDLVGASLDHALWWHAPARADEWLLYVMDSPRAEGGTGLNRGSLFSRDGKLVASVVQEGMMRKKRSK